MTTISKSIKELNQLHDCFETVLTQGLHGKAVELQDLLLVRLRSGYAFVHKKSLRGFWLRIKNSFYAIFNGTQHTPLWNEKKRISAFLNSLTKKLHEANISKAEAVKIQKTCELVKKRVTKYELQSLVGRTPEQVAGLRLVNFGMKNNIEGSSLREKRIHAAYDGNTAYDSLKHGYKCAQAFLQKSQDAGDAIDFEGMKRIVANRRILKEINSNTPSSSLHNRVSELTNPFSTDVVQLGNNSATFCIAGGSKTHYVTYQVKYENGKYFFLIHNRGAGCSDEQLHGTLTIERDGRSYRRTSVCIEITKEHLTNQFFQTLLRTENAPSMSSAYSSIKQYLLTKTVNGVQGRIVKTADEERTEYLLNKSISIQKQLQGWCMPFAKRQELKKKLTQIQDEYKSICNKLVDDDVYHSLQEYGTCTESNKTAPEIIMCDKKTRTKLKCDTVQTCVARIAAMHFRRARNKPVLLELGHKRIAQLQAKIAA